MTMPIRQKIEELALQIINFRDRKISANELEDRYTTAVIIHDDYESLDESLQCSIEMLDNEAKNFSAEELYSMYQQLKGWLEEPPPHEMSNQELEAEFKEWILEYRDWIDKRINLSEDWLEEAFYMAFARSQLHDVIKELGKRRIHYDATPVKILDQQWQAWIMGHKAEDFALDHPRSHIPKKYWWQWVDQLESLSEDEKATL